MSKEEIRRCDHDHKIITGVRAAQQVRYFKHPRSNSDRVRVTIEVHNYRGDVMDLCKKCQTAVFRRIFTRPVRLHHDPRQDQIETGVLGASGWIGPYPTYQVVSDPRLAYVAGLLWAIAGYLWYIVLGAF